MFKLQKRAALAAALCLMMMDHSYSGQGEKAGFPAPAIGSSVTYIGHATVLLRLAVRGWECQQNWRRMTVSDSLDRTG